MAEDMKKSYSYYNDEKYLVQFSYKIEIKNLNKKIYCWKISKETIINFGCKINCY